MAKPVWLLAAFLCLQLHCCMQQVRAAEAEEAHTDRWSVGLEASPEDRSLWRRLADLYRRRTAEEAVAADAAKADAAEEAATDPLLLRRQGGSIAASATPVDADSIPPNYFEVSAARALATAGPPPPPPPNGDGDSGYFDSGGGSSEPMDKNLGIGSEVPAGVDPAEAMAACQPPWCYPAKCTSNCPPSTKPPPTPPPFVCPPGTEPKRRPDGSGYQCVAALRPCVPACRNGGTCAQAKCTCLVGFTGEYCELVNVRQCRLLTGRICPYGCRRAGDTFRCVCPPWITGVGLGANDTCVPADSEGGDGEPCPGTCLNGVCRGGICVCRPGWRGDDCNRDVDECADELLNRCMYQCSNTIGSFRCTCPPGYRLSPSDAATCEPLVCPPGCDRHGRCVDGRCVCDPGWAGDDCQADVDECARRTDCQYGCANTPGSFRCLCPPGHRLLQDGRTCGTADRCEPACQPATGACINGSCACRAGWTGPDCGRDQDECALGFHACRHGCANIPGSFRCLCPPGQRLRPDGRTCACPPGSRPSEVDPAICRPESGDGGPDAWRCSEPTRPCQNGGTCSKPGGRCRCPPGFYGDFCQKRATGGPVCDPPCRAGGTCVDGGRCACPPGRTGPRCERTDPDWGVACSPACRNGRCVRGTCICDVGYEGSACESRFVCAGSADCDRGWCGDDGRCVCLIGWRGARCDQDTNECDLSPAPCAHTCHNEPGSYRCTCDPGFLPGSNGTCAWSSDPACSAGCRNGGRCLGGGRCHCQPGFQGATCSADVDECALGRAVHGCEFACYNTPGGWECRCPPGYTRLPDRRTCRRAPPDARCRPACLNGGVCSGGGTVCACQRGFSGPDCGQDVDECALYRPCQFDCVNTVGSYACRCPAGLLLRFDGIRCITQAEARERPDLLYRGNGVKGHVINGTATPPPAGNFPTPP